MSTLIKLSYDKNSKIKHSGPVHTYRDIFESATFVVVVVVFVFVFVFIFWILNFHFRTYPGFKSNFARPHVPQFFLCSEGRSSQELYARAYQYLKMPKKNKTVKQIKAGSKNKQTTTKKKNRREISDCREKRIYPSTRISKFLFALPDLQTGTVPSYVRAIGKSQRDKQKSE